MYEKCLSINPEDKDLEKIIKNIRTKYSEFKAHMNLGKTALTAGRIEEAINNYKEAAKISTEDGGLHFTIGDLYERMGDITSAYECYKES